MCGVYCEFVCVCVVVFVCVCVYVCVQNIGGGDGRVVVGATIPPTFCIKRSKYFDRAVI